jgi:hypothetical protein
MGNGSIEELLAGYAAAVRAKDADGFIALYASDVRVFDMWGRWSYVGARTPGVRWQRNGSAPWAATMWRSSSRTWRRWSATR